MATEEIEISELEFTEELASDNLIPIESSTDTKATSLQILRDWLKSFFVGKTGDEEISGIKNFTGNLNYKKNWNEFYTKVIHSEFNRGNKPTSDMFMGLMAADKNGYELGRLYHRISTGGDISTRMSARNGDSSTYMGCGFTTDGSEYTYARPCSFANSIVTTLEMTKGKNGYVKLGNGIIIQWGRDTGSGTVTFPTPFASASSYSIANAYGGSGAGDHFYGVVNSLTSTGFKWVKYGSDSTEYWLAIGY